ncbi:MAG: alpha-E domain-containing protein, partial [Rhodobacteraceae bacterium]|nr:alpha-E domain-containing protein [Paracoccaceae bacterium]
AVVRLWRAHHVRLAEATAADEPLLARITAHLAGRGISAEAGIVAAIGPVVSGALTSAGHVRDRFSADGWLALDELDQTLAEIAANAQPGDETVHAMGELLRKINGFSGLVHENMYRFTGWRFLSIGRALERAGILIETLSDFADPAAPDGSLDLATETADSTITHRRRYASAPSRASVVDLLALDPLNPRALLYQLNEITTHLSFLPGGERHRQLPPLQRALLHLQSSVATSTPEALDTQALQHLLPKITGLSELIGEAYFV